MAALPHDVTVELLPSGRLRYRVYNGTRTETLLQDEVLHIRGASRDGIIGQSPIAIARGALSLALANSETAESLSAVMRCGHRACCRSRHN